MLILVTELGTARDWNACGATSFNHLSLKLSGLLVKPLVLALDLIGEFLRDLRGLSKFND